MSEAVEHLCTNLSDEFRRNPRGRGVAPLLARYAELEQDWRPFAFFEQSGYTRNLVHRCPSYELLLLCWSEGQASPIHNHDGKACWMAVLEGEVEELQFRSTEDGSLIEGNSKRYSKGGVGFIQDEIGLHLIRPAAGAGGISLHLYADPIDRCHVYDRETGRSELVELAYHSVRGERCHRPASAVRAEWAR